MSFRVTGIQHVDRGERGVGTIIGESTQPRGADVLDGCAGLGGCECRPLAQDAQRSQAAIAEDLLRRLGDSGEDSADRSRLVTDRAVGVGEVRLLQVAEALHRQVLVVGERCLPGCEHTLQLLSDDVPVFGPHGHAGESEGRVLVGPENRYPRVVVEHRKVRTPPDHHRVARTQADADRRSQALRPLRRGPQRSRRPVERGHPRGHLALAPERRGAGRAIAAPRGARRLRHQPLPPVRRCAAPRGITGVEDVWIGSTVGGIVCVIPRRGWAVNTI